MRLLTALVVGAAAVCAAAETPADLPSGLHVEVRKPIVNRGGTIQARVRWETGGSFFVSGEFTARWQLRSSTGDVVARGRRPVRIGWDEEPPYRFSVRARVPRRVNWDALSLEVALIDDPAWDEEAGAWASGSATVFVEPGRAFFWDGTARETCTGTLEGIGSVVLLRVSDDPWSYPTVLQGPGESAIRANPAWRGASVTVTGRPFEGTCCVSSPESPSPLWVEEVIWNEPLPDYLPSNRYAVGVVPARLPPPEVIGEVNWAKFVRASREPVVVESAAEMAALHDALGTADAGGYDPLGGFEEVDFATHRVVVAFGGICPDPSWTTLIDRVMVDPRTDTTLVEYFVVAPSGGFLKGYSWSESFAAWSIERRDGPVEFLRHEWIPDPPPWW